MFCPRCGTNHSEDLNSVTPFGVESIRVRACRSSRCRREIDWSEPGCRYVSQPTEQRRLKELIDVSVGITPEHYVSSTEFKPAYLKSAPVSPRGGRSFFMS